MSERLTKIIKSIIKSIDESGLKAPSPDIVLDCAVRIYNNPSIAANKSQNSKTRTEKENSVPPTPKQIKFLQRVEHDIPKTKNEATKIISGLLGGNND
jgi:hypothetical protein